MGIFNILDPALNLVFGPLLKLIPAAGIAIIAFVISIIIVLVYKYMTDQDLMKRLKEELKEFQKEAKELKSHPDKAMAVQKKMMETNMKYMVQSFKPTLITFIPVIIIFGWMNAHMAYYPIMPDQEFTVDVFFDKGISGNATISLPEGIELLGSEVQVIADKKASWTLKGDAGEYVLSFKAAGTTETKSLLVTYEKKYVRPIKMNKMFFDYIYSYSEGYISKESVVSRIEVSNQSVHPFGGLSIFGWHPGWIAAYIVFSIVFSIGLRKMFKIH